MSKTLKVKREKSVTVQNEGVQEINRNIIATNAIMTRASLLQMTVDSRRNINSECGYPDSISTSDYQMMYDREGIATKTVSVWPDESWVIDPVVNEDVKMERTVFEKAWDDLQDQLQIYSILMRADEISGIGRFGVVLLGFNDGKRLSQPVQGISDDGTRNSSKKHKLNYMRPFSESSIKIKSTETNQASPRFGKPIMYSVKFSDPSVEQQTGTLETYSVGLEIDIHWTRIIHIADNRKSSEVFGVPRMQILFNRLYDIRKIAGGSGEMFWKGGFPGLSFEMDANAKTLSTAQKQELKNQIADYADGLQRYLTMQGVEAKSLNPQVADPTGHIDVMIRIISIALGIPMRIFMGSEAAKLASNQDTKNWNKRVSKRQNKYITPYIIKPLIERLISAGTLPEVKQYRIEWPDLDTPSDTDKADVTLKYTEAFAKYVGGQVDSLIPPEIFFKIFTDLTPEEIKEIKEEATRQISELDDENDKMLDDARVEEGIPAPERSLEDGTSSGQE